jgi:hypothetical protein
MVNDIFGNEVAEGVLVAVSRQVGYSVGQYAAVVLEVYYDKQHKPKVKVKYNLDGVTGQHWGTPERATSVGLDKVVVVPLPVDYRPVD